MNSDFVISEEIYQPDIYLDEEWEHIAGFPEYRISNFGRVWSFYSNGFLKPYLMNGYHFGVGLRRNSDRYSMYIHQMVAIAFVPNPHNFPVVRHIDDDPANNIATNLIWGTQAQNIQDAIENGHRPGCDLIAIRAIDTNGNIQEFESQNEASRHLGISVAGISKRKDTNKPIKGYIFERLY